MEFIKNFIANKDYQWVFSGIGIEAIRIIIGIFIAIISAIFIKKKINPIVINKFVQKAGKNSTQIHKVEGDMIFGNKYTKEEDKK